MAKQIKHRYYVVDPIDVRASDERYAKRALREFLSEFPQMSIISHTFSPKQGSSVVKMLKPGKPVPSRYNKESKA